MEYVKSRAEYSLEPSKIIEGTEKVILNKVRTSFTTGVDDKTDERLGHLSLVAELVTGLRVSGKTSTKELQVSSYSPGSHYSVHQDAVRLKQYIIASFLRLHKLTRKLIISVRFVRIGGRKSDGLLPKWRQTCNVSFLREC